MHLLKPDISSVVSFVKPVSFTSVQPEKNVTSSFGPSNEKNYKLLIYTIFLRLSIILSFSFSFSFTFFFSEKNLKFVALKLNFYGTRYRKHAQRPQITN